jgi:ribosome-binding factor A
MRRVNEAVRNVVADGIANLKDPRIGLVTVTGVRVTSDLREATVYISALRRTPTLAFAYDDAVERGVRMTKLIDELAVDLPEEPGSADGDRDADE